MFRFVSTWWSLLALALPSCGDFVLDEKIVQFAGVAMELQDIVYSGLDLDIAGFESEPRLFQAEPDVAIAVRHDGYCHMAFRGSKVNIQDWWQNINPTTGTICSNVDSSMCCDARSGFVDAYYTPYAQDVENWIDDCVSNYCSDPDECLVLSGYSQGAAVASVAAVVLAQWNPYVVLLSAPRVIHRPCPAVVDSNRWFHFINTATTGEASILYDIVPFIPAQRADSVGHMILFSPDGDSTRLAYIGLDSQEVFRPNLLGAEHGVAAYLRRVGGITDAQRRGDFPVSSGYADGTLCTKDVECESGVCRGGWLVWMCDRLKLDSCAGSRCASI